MGLMTWLKKVGQTSVSMGGCSARVEPLEERKLMAAGPRVIEMSADNRGQVDLRFDLSLNRDTVTTSSVRIYTAGDDGQLNTADDVRQKIDLQTTSKRIVATVRNLNADTRYRVLLRSGIITDRNGNRLDGDFNGPNDPSGNGRAGGDFAFQARVASTPIARFTTTLGTVDVELFEDDAPITVANFLAYANDGAWDNSFFHRSMADFVVQGGGFKLDDNNFVDNVDQGNMITNEPGISNKRGTIAMAKLSGNPNSATNQWFFNVGDNSGNLDNQNGGFTVFGKIVSGRSVIDDVNDLKTVDAGGAFSDLPVTNDDLEFGINVDRTKDLVMVYRIAVLMRIRAV